MQEDDFTWDNESVKEFAIKYPEYLNQGHSLDSAMLKFKQDKELTPTEKNNLIASLTNQIELVHIYLDGLNIPRKDSKGLFSIIGRLERINKDKKYTQEESDVIKCNAWTAGKYGGHKTYTEYINTTNNAKDIKDWEITSFVHKSDYSGDTLFCVLSNGKFKCDLWSEEFDIDDFLNNKAGKKYYINSVRRLSDKVTFNIGDTVIYSPENKTIDYDGRFWPIDNFFLRPDGAMLARSKDNQMVEIVNCTLLKWSDTDTDRFITDDGVTIDSYYKGPIWRVFTGLNSFPSWKPIELGLPIERLEGEKYFSTEDAAKKYVINHKESVSYSEVYLIALKHRNIIEFENELYEYIENKLNQ